MLHIPEIYENFTLLTSGDLIFFYLRQKMTRNSFVMIFLTSFRTPFSATMPGIAEIAGGGGGDAFGRPPPARSFGAGHWQGAG